MRYAPDSILRGNGNNEQRPLVVTPNGLLTGKPCSNVEPPGCFADDAYGRSRQRQVQAVIDEFWKTRKNEYFTTILQRQKWNEKVDNIGVGGLVVVADPDTTRNR